MAEYETTNYEVQKDGVENAGTQANGSYFTGLILLLVGIVISVSASFLTFLHVGSLAKMTAFEGDLRIVSVVTFAILFVVLGAVLLRDGGAKGYCYVGGLAVLGEALVHFLYVKQRMSNINVLRINMWDVVKFDLGFYVMIAGGIVTMLAGFMMPTITNKVGVIIMLAVVCGLVAAGVIVSLAEEPESDGKKKITKLEHLAKNDDIDFLKVIMLSAEKVASEPQFDGYIRRGSLFCINLSKGEVILSLSGVDSAGEAFVKDAWIETIETFYDTEHGLKLESEEYSRINNGRIEGTVVLDGLINWSGSGISAMTDYSSTFASIFHDLRK